MAVLEIKFLINFSTKFIKNIEYFERENIINNNLNEFKIFGQI
jgi:hypothetical protein